MLPGNLAVIRQAVAVEGGEGRGRGGRGGEGGGGEGKGGEGKELRREGGSSDGYIDA